MMSVRTIRTVRIIGAILASAILFPMAFAAFAYPTVVNQAMTILKPGVQPGIVIFAAPDGVVYAVNAQGQIVKKWTSPEPNSDLGYTRPLPNGNLLGRIQRREADGTLAETGGADIFEMTQAGRVVWKYSDPVRMLHHDQERMFNGNTLITCSKEIRVAAISKTSLKDDCVIEVDGSGKIVWEWQTADHFDELGLSTEARATIAAGREVKGGWDWAHVNAASPIPATTGHSDPRFKPGNVMISYRNLNTIVVVDRESNKIVWKAGMTIGQHNVHMLPAGVPGTGNVLVFDNGGIPPNANPQGAFARPNSRVLEINPLTMTIVSEYNAEKSGRPIWTFFSHFISSAQRQPNGNTLICEGANGRFFEVTPAGEIVWEYVNPFSHVSRNIRTNQVFRASKVPESWLNPT
jgi:Arylsulfotransferase (ASST)